LLTDSSTYFLANSLTKGTIMFKQALVATLMAIGATTAIAAETNPLHPGYAHFTAQANVQSATGNVEIAKNPLTPSYYQWNVASQADSRAVEIVMNNPLQPGYKRS
jgi:hypothetical protein